jgi:putative PIN family toxin of toxin-antitoxin system
VIVIFSQELLEEFIEVARRPKLKKYFKLKDLEALLSQINLYAEFVSVQSAIDICRDKKDNFLLSLAIDSKANYLLTGDKDLLDIELIGPTKIITMREFLNEIISN